MKYIENKNITEVQNITSNEIFLTFTDTLPNDDLIKLYVDVSDYYGYVMGDYFLQNGMVYEIWCGWKYDTKIKDYKLKILYLDRM